MSLTLFYELLQASGETLYMVLISTLLTVLLGLPLGTLLFVTQTIKPHLVLSTVIGSLINFSRSVPFIILLVAIIPFTRLVVGTSIGVHAAIVPLTLGAVFFFARLVHNIYQTLPVSLIEAGFAMGANTWQMCWHILLPEALSAIVQAITVTAITLVNYSAMAGTVGGGGLGDLAIRNGYQQFNSTVMIITVLLLVIIVQLIQFIGDYAAQRFARLRGTFDV